MTDLLIDWLIMVRWISLVIILYSYLLNIKWITHQPRWTLGPHHKFQLITEICSFWSVGGQYMSFIDTTYRIIYWAPKHYIHTSWLRCIPLMLNFYSYFICIIYGLLPEIVWWWRRWWHEMTHISTTTTNVWPSLYIRYII